MAAAAASMRKKNKPASGVRPQISQETFDEVVAENIEEFDMNVEDATRDAVQQFESQGVDLSNIIKTGVLSVAPITGDADTDGNADAPQSVSVIEQIKRAISELEAFSTTTNNAENTANEANPALLTALMQLQDLCDRIPEAKVVAGRNNAVDPLIMIIHTAAIAVSRDTTTTDDVLARASALLASLCSDNTDNQDFVGAAGVAQLAAALQSLAAATSIVTTVAETHLTTSPRFTDAIAHVMLVIRAACTKHEANKSQFALAHGIGALGLLLPLALVDPDGASNSLNRPIAHLVRTLTTNDDATAQFSQALDSVKLLVAHDAIRIALDAITQSTNEPELLSLWLAVLKQLAVTDENCQRIADLDGLALLQRLMVTYETHLHVTTRCIMVVRNVAASDALKPALVDFDVLACVLSGMREHPRDAKLQQHACATLAAVALRSPAIASHVVASGGAVCVTTAMQHHRTNVSLLRQASLAIRNIVARSVELRARVLDDGGDDLEALLRTALPMRGCGDEAYAALRDLGCKIDLSTFGLIGTRAQFNPVQEASSELLETVAESATAPFGS